MNATSGRAPVRSGPSVFGLALAALTLAAVSLWAFTENTVADGTARGSDVEPGSIYNPVTAGERLPDGFRQLLPRDAIRPVYDPEFVSADTIAWPDGTDVIGVEIGGEAKAYPVSFLNGRELVVDEVDGIPILVSW